MFFWNSLAFSMIQCESEVPQSCPTLCDPMDCTLLGSSLHRIFQARILERVAISLDVGNLISDSSAFSKTSLNIWKFLNILNICWSLAWRILSITLLACEMSAIVQEFEHSLALPFFGIGMKTDLFQSCGHYWVFQICWRRGDHKRLQEIFFSNRYVHYLDCCWFHGCVVVQSLSHVWLWDPLDCSMPGLPVPHHLTEFAQVHVHCISDAVQLSHLLLLPSIFPSIRDYSWVYTYGKTFQTLSRCSICMSVVPQ